MHTLTRRRMASAAAACGALAWLPGAHAQSQKPDSKSASKSARKAASQRTGWVDDPRFALQAFGARHPEQPRRAQAVATRVAGTPDLAPRLHRLTPVDFVEPAIKLVHTDEHIRGIAERYDADVNTLARAAAGAACAAIDALAAGDVRNAFVASRPPGHHARNTGKEEGFCFFNNVAIAARRAQRLHGMARVLIVDWDYHHGDGTEQLFYDDPTVFYFSTFDPDAYPGTGSAARTGEGAGRGFTMNNPLACGASDADVLKIYRERLVAVANRFKPNLVLISAGFDSRVDDLLGCFKFTDAGYAQMTRLVGDIAARHCRGRLVSVMEGGYNIDGLASAATAHLRALTDLPAA